jgi:hypothetical protein
MPVAAVGILVSGGSAWAGSKPRFSQAASSAARRGSVRGRIPWSIARVSLTGTGRNTYIATLFYQRHDMARQIRAGAQ